MVNIFTTDAEKSALYEAIGRAVAAYSKLEHVAIELALVWDKSRKTYGTSLASAGKYAMACLAEDPHRRDAVASALECIENLTATRNAIVHGVWMEVHLDDAGRFFSVRTLPRSQTKDLENPEYLRGKAMSTADIRMFAEACESRERQIGAVRDGLHADRRTKDGERARTHDVD